MSPDTEYPPSKSRAPSPARLRANEPVKKQPRQMQQKACERCRRRKIKCDEFLPCSTCTRLKVACRVVDGDRRGERSQSALEDRVQRLESLLAANKTQNTAIDGYGSTQMQQSDSMGAFHDNASLCQPTLSLQIPTTLQQPNPDGVAPISSPDYYSPSPSDTDFLDSGSYALSPDFGRSSPLPFGTDRLFADSPGSLPQRSDSLPLSSNQLLLNGGQFENAPGRGILFSDIPTIEVTSWDHSYPEAPPSLDFANDIMFNLPDLSTGECSGPPSIALSEYSFNSPLEDNFLSLLGGDTLPMSRRPSFTFSDFSDTPGPIEYSRSRMNRARSTSDVFPVSNKSPNHFRTRSATPALGPGFVSQNLEDIGAMPTAQPFETDIEKTFSHAFFSMIHPFFPISSPQSFATILTNLQSHNLSLLTHGSSLSVPLAEEASVLLILAIGAFIYSSQSSEIASRYYMRATQKYAFSCSESRSEIQAMMLLCLYTIVTGHEKPNIWRLNANIVAAVIDLGLHVSVSWDEGDDIESERERNLLVAAYALDRTVSIVKDRPFALHDCDLEAEVLGGVRVDLKARALRVRELGKDMRKGNCGMVLKWFRSVEEKL